MWLLLLSLAFAGDADTPRGGGITFHDVHPDGFQPGVAWWSSSDTQIGCIGGMGFETRFDIRRGGEGHACFGEDTLVVYGGPQFGWLRQEDRFYGSIYASFGLGFAGMEDDYSSMFAYLKPTVAGAWVPGAFGLDHSGTFLVLSYEDGWGTTLVQADFWR